MTNWERKNAATFLEYTTVKPFCYINANFKCFYCDKVFSEIDLVLEHTEVHSVPERPCLMNDHLKKGKRVIKVDISKLNCKICGKRYTDLNNIRKHLIKKHEKEFTIADHGLMAYNLRYHNGLLTCHTCRKTFTTFHLLNMHMNVHLNVVCETCGMGFNSYQRLINHKIVHQKGVHQCEECGEILPTRLRLRYHFDTKHDVKNDKRTRRFKCSECPERFTEHYQKMSHMKDVHAITFHFECPACKVVFLSRRALREHTVREHTKEIKCEECGKCFGTQTILKMHARKHVGVKNFACPICQKSYMHERSLYQHRTTIHGPVWKDTCKECGLEFDVLKDFKKHIKEQHPHIQLTELLRERHKARSKRNIPKHRRGSSRLMIGDVRLPNI